MSSVQLNRIVEEFDYYLFDFASLCEKAKVVKLVLLYFNEFPVPPFKLDTISLFEAQTFGDTDSDLYSDSTGANVRDFRDVFKNNNKSYTCCVTFENHHVCDAMPVMIGSRVESDIVYSRLLTLIDEKAVKFGFGLDAERTRLFRGTYIINSHLRCSWRTEVCNNTNAFVLRGKPSTQRFITKSVVMYYPDGSKTMQLSIGLDSKKITCRRADASEETITRDGDLKRVFRIATDKYLTESEADQLLCYDVKTYTSYACEIQETNMYIDSLKNKCFKNFVVLLYKYITRNGFFFNHDENTIQKNVCGGYLLEWGHSLRTSMCNNDLDSREQKHYNVYYSETDTKSQSATFGKNKGMRGNKKNLPTIFNLVTISNITMIRFIVCSYNTTMNRNRNRQFSSVMYPDGKGFIDEQFVGKSNKIPKKLYSCEGVVESRCRNEDVLHLHRLLLFWYYRQKQLSPLLLSSSGVAAASEGKRVFIMNVSTNIFLKDKHDEIDLTLFIKQHCRGDVQLYGINNFFFAVTITDGVLMRPFVIPDTRVSVLCSRVEHEYWLGGAAAVDEYFTSVRPHCELETIIRGPNAEEEFLHTSVSKRNMVFDQILNTAPSVQFSRHSEFLARFSQVYVDGKSGDRDPAVRSLRHDRHPRFFSDPDLDDSFLLLPATFDDVAGMTEQDAYAIDADSGVRQKNILNANRTVKIHEKDNILVTNPTRAIIESRNPNGTVTGLFIWLAFIFHSSDFTDMEETIVQSKYSKIYVYNDKRVTYFILEIKETCFLAGVNANHKPLIQTKVFCERSLESETNFEITIAVTATVDSPIYPGTKLFTLAGQKGLARPVRGLSDMYDPVSRHGFRPVVLNNIVTLESRMPVYDISNFVNKEKDPRITSLCSRDGVLIDVAMCRYMILPNQPVPLQNKSQNRIDFLTHVALFCSGSVETFLGLNESRDNEYTETLSKLMLSVVQKTLTTNSYDWSNVFLDSETIAALEKAYDEFKKLSQSIKIIRKKTKRSCKNSSEGPSQSIDIIGEKTKRSRENSCERPVKKRKH